MYDKDRLIAAIWDNPQYCMPLTFERRGGLWVSAQNPDGSTHDGEHRKDRTTLKQGRDRSGDATIWVNYNGDGYPAGQTIWKYLHWLWNTNEHVEVLQRLGDAYGIQPDLSAYSPEQIERVQRRRTEADMLRHITKCVTAALQSPKHGEVARDYLKRRGLQASERMGAWNSGIRVAIKDSMKKKYGLSEKAAEDYLVRFFPPYYPDDYQLVLPYYNGAGNVIGFALRLTSDKLTYTDKDGAEVKKKKYQYSAEMPRGTGYCEALHGGDEVAYIVEGQIDAENMKQHGFGNVIALGGQSIGDDFIKTLQRYNVRKVMLIPDCEYYDADDERKGIGVAGRRKTKATSEDIAALLPHMATAYSGDGFISVRVADLETADSRQQKTKVDADAYLNDYGEAGMRGVVHDAVQWYEAELRAIVEDYADDTDTMTAKATDVFCSMQNPAQRQRLKDSITSAKYGYLATLRNAGLSAAELTLIEAHGGHSTWASRIAEVVADMGKAKTSESMGALLTKAQQIQQADAYADFAAQIDATREEIHAQVADKPDYLQTSWTLWREHYDKATQETKYYEARKISFAPCAVSVLAAPTNHGKTLILLQTAINAAKDTHSMFLYLSVENDLEQLYVRAVTAYMGDVWSDSEQNPRAALREHIRAADCPRTLFGKNGKSIDVDGYIRKYWREVAPYLRMAWTNTDIDAIQNNVQNIVEAWRAQGLNVGGVFIDYLQRVQYPAMHAHSRTDELKGICDRLNDIAKATKLPIIVAAQFNRDATKTGGDMLDGVELANIGESAGIENVAEDVYLLWQIDKINTAKYHPAESKGGSAGRFKILPNQYRSRRCFADEDDEETLLRGHLYVENLKARDFATGGYCLLPYNGAAGAVTSDESLAAHGRRGETKPDNKDK